MHVGVGGFEKEAGSCCLRGRLVNLFCVCEACVGPVVWPVHVGMSVFAWNLSDQYMWVCLCLHVILAAYISMLCVVIRGHGVGQPGIFKTEASYWCMSCSAYPVSGVLLESVCPARECMSCYPWCACMCMHVKCSWCLFVY